MREAPVVQHAALVTQQKLRSPPRVPPICVRIVYGVQRGLSHMHWMRGRGHPDGSPLSGQWWSHKCSLGVNTG